MGEPERKILCRPTVIAAADQREPTNKSTRPGRPNRSRSLPSRPSPGPRLSSTTPGPPGTNNLRRNLLFLLKLVLAETKFIPPGRQNKNRSRQSKNLLDLKLFLMIEESC